MPGFRPVAVALFCCLAASGLAAGQTIDLRGGVSQEERASGGGVTLTSSPYSLDVFSGVFNGRLEVGANIKAELGRYKLVAGDQMLELRSAIYGDQSRGYYARGASVAVPIGTHMRAMAFAGVTGTSEGSILFQVVRPNQPIGSLRADYDMTKSLTVFFKSLFSNRQTAIGGFDYRLGPGFHAGAQAGIGSNTPYGAVTLDYANKAATTTMDGSYTAASRQFQMVELSSLNYQDPVHENGQFMHKFGRALQITYRRTNFQFRGSDGAQSAFNGNSVSLIGRLRHTGWYAGFNESSGQQKLAGVVTARNGDQVNFGMSQGFGRYHFNASYYQPLSASGSTSLQGFTTLMVQEPLGRWASLRQIASHSDTWGVAYGGEIHNNWLNLSVDYQTTYNLFEAGSGRFQQGMVVEGDMNLPKGVKLFVGTDITPDGRYYYKWGTRASFKGPFQGGQPGEEVDQTPSIPRWVLWGKVVEGAANRPVADFPVNIGQETVFTNDEGEFSMRLFSGRAVNCSPDTKIPHAGFEFRLVSGPEKAVPTKDGHGAQYLWKLERGKPAPASGAGGLVVDAG